MYTEAQFKNSRCLRDVRLRLSPLTVLVGPNAAGKTAMLMALMGRLGNPWRGEEEGEVSVSVTDGETRYYRAERGAEDFLVDRPRPLRQDSHLYLRLRADAVRQPNQLAKEHRLAVDGRNVTNVIASLKRDQQIELAAALARHVPAYADVDTDPTGEGFHRVILKDAYVSTLWYPPQEVSDGTMLLLAMQLLRFHEDISLVLIEEPDRSIHPHLFGGLVDDLRALTTGPDPKQVIIATHSAELLEHVDPGEIRLVTRDAEGATVIDEISTDTEAFALASTLHDGSLSSLWLSGGLGGSTGEQR